MTIMKLQLEGRRNTFAEGLALHDTDTVMELGIKMRQYQQVNVAAY